MPIEMQINWFEQRPVPTYSHVVPLTVESWNQLFQEIKGFAELFDHSEDEPMAA